jgi:small subunit ribosomal protein S7
VPRRARIQKRVILPDPVYTHEGVAKFVNVVMQRGKRSTAERVVYGSLDRIRKVAKKDPIEVFDAALKNATPVLEVKPRRIGGATYQVPVEIRGDRRLSLGVRWLVQAARKRSGKSMSEKLAAEFVDAMNGLGAAVKRREDTHKMAEANRAFSHFKW